jgi:hypothetical protein
MEESEMFSVIRDWVSGRGLHLAGGSLHPSRLATEYGLLALEDPRGASTMITLGADLKGTVASRVATLAPGNYAVFNWPRHRPRACSRWGLLHVDGPESWSLLGLDCTVIGVGPAFSKIDEKARSDWAIGVFASSPN